MNLKRYNVFGIFLTFSVLILILIGQIIYPKVNYSYWNNHDNLNTFIYVSITLLMILSMMCLLFSMVKFKKLIILSLPLIFTITIALILIMFVPSYLNQTLLHDTLAFFVLTPSVLLFVVFLIYFKENRIFFRITLLSSVLVLMFSLIGLLKIANFPILIVINMNIVLFHYFLIRVNKTCDNKDNLRMNSNCIRKTKLRGN